MFLIYFTITILSSIFLTYLARSLAKGFKLLDHPTDKRKIHKKPIPLSGGWAIFLSFFLIIFIFSSNLIVGDLSYSHWLGFFIGAFIIMVGGTLDDLYNLKASQQIIFPILAVVSVLLGGVEITYLSNPFGDLIILSDYAWLSALLIFVWLLAMMYTTKLLDGVDGLVSGLGAIGAFIIFLFTSLTDFLQPDIAFAAFILAIACLGFLYFNFSPASIFLGEGGSLFIGYALGVLAIISGAKIAITLLIIALPALDLVWTIIRRIYKKKNPFRFADKEHLHHRLLDLGLSQRQTAFFYYFIALFFGLAGLFLQSQGKFLALLFLFILMIALVIYFSYFKKNNKKKKLLLHTCCAPCASYVSISKLIKKFDLTWYFYNSNIYSLNEYNKRLDEVKKICNEKKIKLIIEPYNNLIWQEKIKGYEKEKERGKRCYICYKDRLIKTAKLAKKLKFDYFSSSLLISPYKDRESLIDIAVTLEKELLINFYKVDYSQNLYNESISYAKKKKMYLQNFCACLFSKKIKE